MLFFIFLCDFVLSDPANSDVCVITDIAVSTDIVAMITVPLVIFDIKRTHTNTLVIVIPCVSNKTFICCFWALY